MASNNLDDLSNQINSVDDSEMPQWAKLLLKCFQGVITAVKEQKCDLCETHEININQLRLEVNTLNEIKQFKKLNDDNEQRSRNECLILHGCEENVNEDTDNIVREVLQNKLQIKLTDGSIKNSHRLGPPSNKRNTRSKKDYTRPIIFRLMFFRDRMQIFQNKRKLKGQKESISENLTALRYGTLKAAKEKFGNGNVWSSHGRIITKIGNTYHSFTCMEELQRL